MTRAFIFLHLLILLSSCFHKDEKNVDVGYSDTSANYLSAVNTIIASVQGIENSEKEYFLIINSDTSRFSLFVGRNAFGNIVASYAYVPHRSYSRNLDADSTATFDEFVENKRLSNQGFSQMTELRQLMKRASSDYDMTKLKNIRFGLKYISGLSDTVTVYYKKKYGQKITSESNKLVAEILFNSKFVDDLNNDLRPYSVSVKVISIDGLAYYQGYGSSVKLFDGLIILTL